MDKYLADITKLFEKNHMSDLSSVVKEKKMLFLYYFYHYYNGDEDYLLEVREGCDYNNSSKDNYAQAFFREETTDGEQIDIIVPYYVDDNETFDKLKLMTRKKSVEALLTQIKKTGYYSADAAQSKIKDYWDAGSEAIGVIKLITNYIPLYDEKKKLRNTFESQDLEITKINVELIFGDEIIDDVKEITNDKPYVSSSTIKLIGNNYLAYGQEQSLIVNISALSLKENYSKYKKSGLFAMNLRFYISDKKVDPGIEDSIRNHPENFWYLNNGIIIVCDDYKIEDGKINLTNFSIVNGGQTTRMIGEVPFANDFAISCKIIKAKNNNDNDNSDFVAAIAEASNNQKPIKSEDLIANRSEQRNLKLEMSKVGVFVSTKRGDSTAANLKINYPNMWSRSKNVEIAQLLYSFVYQGPGYARNSANKLFSVEKKYNLIFKDKAYSPYMLKDLLYIRSYYDKWKKDVVKTSEDPVKVGLVKNSATFFYAIIGLITKLKFCVELKDDVDTYGINSEKGIDLISQMLYNHRIFNKNFDDLEDDLFSLFNAIYDFYIVKAFNSAKNFKPDLSYSNFTKVDKNYQTLIIPNVYNDFYDFNNLSSKWSLVIGNYFYECSEEDDDVTNELLQKALSKDIISNDEDEIVDEIASKIAVKLTEFRKLTADGLGIKPQEILNNKEIDNISKFKPTTTEQLLMFGCIKVKPNTKIKLYGSNITKIVKSIIGGE